jgi:predicted component of viral defense system (DUF524 family)
MPLLIEISGKSWKLEVIGKLPDLPPFISIKPQSAISFSGTDSVNILDRQKGFLRPIVSGEMVEPLLFEHVTYDIHLEKLSDVILTMPFGTEPRRIRQDSEHHSINFQNNVGYIDIQISAKEDLVKLRLEVFSRKIDYRTDYLRMRDEVSQILRNLAMTASAKTYGLAAPDRSHRPTLVEWFSLVKTYFEEFVKLTTAISKKPHSALKNKPVQKITSKARKVSRVTLAKALHKSSNGPMIAGTNLSLPRNINEEVSYATFDTAENRYYKGLLETTYRNLRALSRLTQTDDEDAERDLERQFFNSIKGEVKAMQRRLELAMAAPFLATVRKSSLKRPLSLVFHKSPEYSRIDKMARLFNSGLSFIGDIVPIAVKDTALLYEYWCFLKIVDLLREHFDLEQQNVVKINRFRTTITLAKGVSAAMRFKHRSSEEILYIIYNRLFDRLPTIAQKPDNVIQLANETGFYIFDAKYRLQFDHDYILQYGGVGPSTEDINTMHRYRDAIAIPHPLKPNTYIKGSVHGAIILFPLPDEVAYKAHKFYKSISQVEIGGIPFLPDTTTLMAGKLASILSKYSLEETAVQ